MVASDLAVILERLDLVQIIGEYLPLRQTGKTFKGLCPFHPEKTPSFHLNPERGLWHCFGCGAGGDIATFLMKIDNLTFPEVKALLAKKAGIELTPEQGLQSKKRRRWQEILEIAAQFYQQMLFQSSPGEEGLRYLEARGITNPTIQQFKLGMAPVGGSGLLNYLLKRGFKLEELREIGVVTKPTPSRDYFFKRIIFPIWDTTGNIIGFGGRALGQEVPKYLNSPESPLFKKGENLYPIHLAKGSISKEGRAILAEGYLDVLMLHQHGFTQSVATLGTSLTLNQAKLLMRYAPKVTLSYDGDRAGIEAMRRAITIAEAAGIDLGLITLPDGEDPDSFLRKQGAERFSELLTKDLSPLDFVFQRTQTKLNLNLKTPEGKKKMMTEITPLLQAIHDPVLRDAYIRKMAEALLINESIIRKQLLGKSQIKFAATSGSPSREKEILAWILWEPSLAATVWSTLTPDDFGGEECRAAASTLYRLWQEEKRSFSELEEVPSEVLAFLSKLSTEPPAGKIEAVPLLVKAQQDHNLKKELVTLKNEVTQRLKEGKVDPTDEAYMKYLALLRQAKKQGEGA